MTIAIFQILLILFKPTIQVDIIPLRDGSHDIHLRTTKAFMIDKIEILDSKKSSLETFDPFGYRSTFKYNLAKGKRVFYIRTATKNGDVYTDKYVILKGKQLAKMLAFN